MQRQILINVMIFFAYALNLPLNTQRPHHRSQRAGKLGLDFGSWQSPDISRSHLYRGTFPWTPPTAIYRAYTVHEMHQCTMLFWKMFSINKIIIMMNIKSIHFESAFSCPWPIVTWEMWKKFYKSILISNLFYELISWMLPAKSVLGECHRIQLMINVMACNFFSSTSKALFQWA